MKNLKLEMELDAIRHLYDESENLLLLWEALKLCLDENYPVPDWVSPYFSIVAADFIKLSNVAQTKKFDRRVAIEVYKALRMSEPGAHNVFRKYSNLKRDADIIRDYYQLNPVDDGGNADDKMGHVNAAKAVAEKWKVSESLVNKLIFSSREKMGNLPENYHFELNEKRKKRAKNKALRKKKALERQKLQT